MIGFEREGLIGRVVDWVVVREGWRRVGREVFGRSSEDVGGWVGGGVVWTLFIRGLRGFGWVRLSVFPFSSAQYLGFLCIRGLNGRD